MMRYCRSYVKGCVFSSLGVDHWTNKLSRCIPKHPIAIKYTAAKTKSSMSEKSDYVTCDENDSGDEGDLSKGLHQIHEAHSMELDILEKKIRRLVCKLKKHNIDLEVFDHEDIRYGTILGKGGEGVVQKCTITYNDLPVDAAVKTVMDCSDDAMSITLDEIELLCLGQDPVVNTTLRVYGVAAVPNKNDPTMGHLVILTEAGIMNALQLYQGEKIPLHVTMDLWSRMAAAIHCLHTKKILHQDLKPENVLITGVVRDSSGQIEKINFKIIDFGMGRRLFNDKIVTDDILGTNGYHPPEVLFEDTYDFRADVFMLGITFAVMLHGPEFLNSGGFKQLLKKLHGAKKQKKTGSSLYEHVLEPSILEHGHHEVPLQVKTLLCTLMEKQSKRTISLVDVVQTLRRESDRLKQIHNLLPTLMVPCHNCQDSGIGSYNDESKPPSVVSGQSVLSTETKIESRMRLRSQVSESELQTLPPKSKRKRPASMETFAEPQMRTRAAKRQRRSKENL